ncbi:CDP-glucose 4,6-dehydratase [Mucilaginibacter gossypii]|uniref:CDP-glucose 4,6-dehydratase n=1 Tax=Mucilaginibacter gossypii TaxID=551996 RepID=UPI001AA1A2D2|nr:MULTISPECIES: CDP-glucose 4,6-dehydratase [Mucilaginibacter]QTE40260.1 CDP-glucose 4,6-dehydratase [Mucilaginibacter gossypii]
MSWKRIGQKIKLNGKFGNMFDELKKIYNGKKVFLTGHTGFKGSWLLKILTMLGAEVKGYSLAPENDFDLYHVLNGDAICESVIADLRDRNKLTEAVESFQPDFVFHLAAQPLVRLSYDIPSETFEVNAIGTANLLDAVRLVKKACQVVLITTDKVYHNYEWVFPYRENDRLGGYDPYSASKACAELVIDSYRNSFFNQAKYEAHQKAIAVGRAGNVIGGGDWAKDRLIPDIVRAISKSETVIIRNPGAVRPWQHVMEPIFGYLLLGSCLVADPLKFSTAYNFGPQLTDALPVKQMVELSIAAWGKGAFEVVTTAHQPHEAGLLKLDITKAVTELKWNSRFNAETAIQKTINWYKEYLNNPEGIVSYTENQILEFTGI